MTQIVIANFHAVTGEILAQAEPVNGEPVADLLARVKVDFPNAFVADLPAIYKSGWLRVKISDKTLFSDDVAHDKATALAVWMERMNRLDAGLSRAQEDLFDALDPISQARVATETANKVAAKKALRTQRP